ncbi:cell division protein CrgA [Mobilicoccus massiliensis]|uniref:cell division protein CrgA n=1 Tax=Mobilicoccus massiliensis TaxID=1522310 RepID=UPI000AD4E292|nr:cell division protein CrgA [Mobilicoccus massiliensis]
MSASKRPKKSAKTVDTQGATASGPKPNPSWYVPLMLGLMIIGLVWIVVFYLTAGSFPVEAWGNWNLAAGFGLIIAGFLMTTNWR